MKTYPLESMRLMIPERQVIESPEAENPHWYEKPEAAERLALEHKKLAEKYNVQCGNMSDGEIVFRLTPRKKALNERVVLYLVCEPEFPQRTPWAFLLAGKHRHHLLCPLLSDWTPRRTLLAVADDLIEWLLWSRDEYTAKAERALQRGNCQEAHDLLEMVLALEPRTPDAARMLAQAQARLECRGEY
jgi:hypothetical protein